MMDECVPCVELHTSKEDGTFCSIQRCNILDAACLKNLITFSGKNIFFKDSRSNLIFTAIPSLCRQK